MPTMNLKIEARLLLNTESSPDLPKSYLVISREPREGWTFKRLDELGKAGPVNFIDDLDLTHISTALDFLGGIFDDGDFARFDEEEQPDL